MTQAARSRQPMAEYEETRDAGLAQRCTRLAAELSLLGGVADALARRGDTRVAIHDVLAATFQTARIAKGALVSRSEHGPLQIHQHIGFSDAEHAALGAFFGHRPFLDDVVDQGGSLCIPSSSVPALTAAEILGGANVASLQIVPLRSTGRGGDAMIIGSTQADVASADSAAFARAIGNQIIQSLALSQSVAHLRASEQRYRTLLEKASDAVAILTVEGIVREVNHRWEEMTGLPREQLVGRHLSDFALPAGDDQHARTFNAAIAAHAGRPVPVEIVGARGTGVLLEFSSTKVEVDDEPLVLTISRDVTEQRALEDRLFQAEKLEGIGQLAGGVAHDFNNLLTAIFGFAELVLRGLPPEDPARSGLGEIKKAAERAAALTRQLLTFSRKQFLAPSVLDINTAIVGLEPMLRRLMLENIGLTMALRATVGLVRMDPTQVDQMLVNLAINAADAMPDGGMLTIETANVTLDAHYQRQHLPLAAGAYVVLSVSDTGIGMDDATIRRVFEPFFTTKTPGKGTGLGLATVYGIVKQSGGDIWIYSEPGLGSTFKVYLPQEDACQASVANAAPPAVEFPRGVETILLVEEDDAVRRLTRGTLERLGYYVVAARQAREAVRLATESAGTIDLLLSDVAMPEVDGPPLVDRLRQRRPGLRVLYMSAYAGEAIVRRGVITGDMPFLQKPFTPSALARTVRDVLDAQLAPVPHAP